MKTLIIGYGSIGARHARIADSFGWDLALVSKQANLPFKTFSSISTALEEFSPHAVIIATETTEHYRCICEFEKYGRGLKILVEKPLFDSEIDFQPMHNRYFVAYNLRFHPVYKKIKNEIKGEKVIYAHITCGSFLPNWRPGRNYLESYSASILRGGGVLNDLSHEIDCAIDWFASNQLVYGACENSGTLKIETEDLCSILLTNDSNSTVFVHMDYLSRIPYRRGIIQCESKTIQYDFIANSVQVSGNEPEYFECEGDYSYLEQLVALDRSPNLLCSFDEGKQIMSLISEIRNYSKTKTTRSFPGRGESR